MDPDVELVVVTGAIGPRVIEGPGVTGRLIKAKGRILTLTADEAVACGLASGVAASIDDLPAHLGLETWHPESERAWHRVAGRAKAQRAREADARREAAERAQRAAVRSTYIERVMPEVKAIEERLSQLTARRKASEDAEAELERQRYWELATAVNDYNGAINQASLRRDSGYWYQRAKEIYDIRVAEISNRYHEKALELQMVRKEAEYGQRELTTRYKRLLDQIPPE